MTYGTRSPEKKVLGGDIHSSLNGATEDDDKVDDSVRCKECGHNEWVCRYGDYELWGTCAKCGNVESLYSG